MAFENSLPEIDEEFHEDMSYHSKIGQQKRLAKKKEEKTMAEEHKRGGTRIAQLTETKRRFFEMVGETRSVEDIEAMLNEAPGGPPSGTAVRHWWAEARKRAGTTSHIVEASVPIPDTPQSEVPEHPKGGVIGPPQILKAETPEVFWNDVMRLRPDFSDKPRLGRWMDMVDAVYAFLVESDHEEVQR